MFIFVNLHHILIFNFKNAYLLSRYNNFVAVFIFFNLIGSSL